MMKLTTPVHETKQSFQDCPEGITRFRDKSFLIEEVWFDTEPQDIPGVDIRHYYQRSQPIAGIQFNEFYTMLLDLTQDQNTIWQNLSKTNKYKIRRAIEKDQLSYQYWDSNTINAEVLRQFFDFYDQFSVAQGLKKLQRSRILSFVKSGILDLSVVRQTNGSPLVWHAHCHVNQRSCFFYSASIKNSADSAYQSLLGRANRYHHWQDILRFQSTGSLLYDFGGWYAGNTDQKLLNINQFKAEFKGEIIRNFVGYQGRSLKGKLGIYLHQLLNH
jgi:hypothetical protein